MAGKKASFFSELKRRNVYRVGIAYIIASWLLLQVIDVVKPIIGLPDWVAKFTLVVLIIGFPMALLFSWAYEMTPEGLKREKDVHDSQSIAHNTGQRLDRITIGIAAMALAIFAADKFLAERSPPPIRETAVATTPAEDVPDVSAESTLPAIAVLPFVNMSADENSAYFSDGLADTLLHMLAQLPEIRVAARTSSFRFRDQDTDIKDIATALGVGNVLEGSVQKSGNRIRVTAQLIEAKTGFHLWSGNFDRDLHDLFAIQDEIATEVVAALKVSLLGESVDKLARRGTDDLEAYTEYLLGVDKLELNTTRSLAEAERHFTRASELDPGYARALGMKGLTYLRMVEWGSGTREVLLPKAREAASQAMRIDEDSAIATTVLGAVELQLENDGVAERLLRGAIQADPNTIPARLYYAQLLAVTGRRDEALGQLKEALAIDPLSARINFLLASIHRSSFEYDESIRYLDRVAEIEPLSPIPYGVRGDIEFDRGNWARSVADHMMSFRLDPDDPEIAISVGQDLICLQLPEAAKHWFDRAAEISPEHLANRQPPLLLELYNDAVSSAAALTARDLLEKKLPNRMGTNDIAILVIWRHAVEHGSIDTTLNFFREQYPAYFAEAGDGGIKDFDLRIRIGDLFRRAGMREDAKRLLDGDVERARADLANDTIMQMVHLLPLAAAGERQLLLQALRLYTQDVIAGRESPFLWNLRLAKDPLFALVHDDPEYTDLINLLQKRATEQRALLLEMYGGDYPTPE